MKPFKPEIDLGLAVLEVLTPPGVRLSLKDIAAVCGCTWQCIFQIEQRALRKLRRFMQRETNADLSGALREMLAFGNRERTCTRAGESHYARRAA